MMISLLALIAATLVACGGEKTAEHPRNDDSVVARANPATGTAQGSAAADSIAGRQSRRSAIDSAILAPPPPLDPAPAKLSADTIPLRAPNGEPARYGLKSGRIVQRYTGNSRGERRIIFDDYGMRERREEMTQPYPEGSRGNLSNIILITTPQDQAYGDVRTKHGYRTPNDGLKRYLEMGASKTTSLGEMVMTQSGAERLPDTVIAGYRCRVLRKQVKGMTVTDWFWRGIAIREHVVSPADNVEYTIEPIEITPDVAVPAETFNFPADFKIDPFTPRPGNR